MAIIDGHPLEDDAPPARTRVVIKLTKDADSGVRDSRLSAGDALSHLKRLAPDAQIAPYFSEIGDLRATALDPFDRYVSIEVADREAGAALARAALEIGTVEDAYVEGGPTPPPVNPADDPRSGAQGYLAAAPAGIEARWAWGMTDGAGVGFVDLEQGWTLDHEDLAAAGITLISGQNLAWPGHGTAVLGEVVGVDNNRGGIGIAPAAQARVVSQWRAGGGYNTAEAILSAGAAMSAGDVLLLEAQTPGPTGSYMPVEIETAVFDAIRHVVGTGISVIEAAGNGGNDLDLYRDGANRRILNRGSADFRDSGAVMVGAASSAVPHFRLGFSNHGSRIDCYAWGENIDTCGDGAQGTSTTAYTTGFGGTSGASPIVTGAAILLQSWSKAQRNRLFSPHAMRDNLSATALNTASANPAVDRIGVMPNLRAIIEFELVRDRARFREPNLAFLSWVIYGLVDDSPGVIWDPLRGPIPVDPDWFRSALTGPKRDLLAALAMSEMAALIEDEAIRSNLSEASAAAMRAAVNRIGEGPPSVAGEGRPGCLSALFGARA